MTTGPQIERLLSPGFRIALAEMLMSGKPLPPKYVFTKVTALAEDGRERPMTARYDGPRIHYEAVFGEGEVLTSVRVEFADGSSEVVPFRGYLRPSEGATVSFVIDF